MQSIEPCQILEWDSQFFGRTIGRVNEHRLDPQRMATILKWCKDYAVECLYFLADSDHPDTIRLAGIYGFRLVDIRVALQCRVADCQTQSISSPLDSMRVRPADPSDIPALQAIARKSHTDSRFYADECFSRETCADLYAVWIKRSCEGYADCVLVAEQNGQPVGYCSCHLHDTQGQIGLVGICEQARGQGLGRHLTQQAVRWFAEQGVAVVNVVTQGRNVTAQRLYQRCGFLVQSVHLWYHKWMPDCTTRSQS